MEFCHAQKLNFNPRLLHGISEVPAVFNQAGHFNFMGLKNGYSKGNNRPAPLKGFNQNLKFERSKSFVSQRICFFVFFSLVRMYCFFLGGGLSF